MDGIRADIIVAENIGSPMDYNLPVSLAIEKIAEVKKLKADEYSYVFDYSCEREDVDDIYAIGDSSVTGHKISPVEPVRLVPVGLKSKLEYVLLDDISPAVDQGALAAKKAGISRAMDKMELKRICDAVLSLDGSTGKPNCEVSVTGDIDDLLRAMVHQIEDYGTVYAALTGATAKTDIDNYDKSNVTTANYRLIQEFIKNAGIEVVKITGKVNGVDVLAGDKIILVATSPVAGGKPILFARQLLSPEAQKIMKTENAERGIWTSSEMTMLDGGLIGFGTLGYEKIIEAITNYKAICWATIP